MIPKFRAWDKRKNVMRDVAVLHFTKNGKTNFIEYWINPTELKSYHVRNIDLMQSTGLKDKNGVEIFEGDLVEHDDNLNGDWETFEACEVVYDKDYAQFCFKWDAGNFLTDYRNLNVIGNIYENSELLEVE
ncbi:YopX family protein [Enterococcus faecium]|uniref:YopX family protein n=1 Tax=Enterococcus faecium TaxID=1352 RepID=UPI003DA6C521